MCDVTISPVGAFKIKPQGVDGKIVIVSNSDGGPVINKEQFIRCMEILENAYFCGKLNTPSTLDVLDKPVSRISPTCPRIEEYITQLLNKEQKWEEKDIIRILAWKTGKIKHVKTNCDDTEKELKLEYHSGWDEDALTIQLPNQAGNVDVSELAYKACNTRQKYIKRQSNNAEECWNDLKAATMSNQSTGKYIRGLGPVYLLTLYSFITCGEYPIYDRFAMAALAVLEKGQDISNGSMIIIDNPSQRSISSTNDIRNSGLYVYYRRLFDNIYNEIAPDRDQLSEFERAVLKRKIDRALWVYGHWFRVLTE